MKPSRNQYYHELKNKLKTNKSTYYVEREINAGELCEITFYIFLIFTLLTSIAKCTT